MVDIREEKFQRLQQLHVQDGTFVIPNAWDAGSCRILSSMGFEAIATTSAGLAFSMGRRDSALGLTLEHVIDNTRDIVDATDLPVSADLEEGFGVSPEHCVNTTIAAFEAGAVAGAIEDATGDRKNPIFDFAHAVERIAAVCETTADMPFMVTARSENFLYGRPDLDDTIKRLQAFSKVGADVLYAPGLKSLEDIQLLCQEVDKPVNVVMGLSGVQCSVEELQSVGVKRVSVGGSFARAALGEFIRAAQEVKEQGTFTYSDRAISDRDAAAYMSFKKR